MGGVTKEEAPGVGKEKEAAVELHSDNKDSAIADLSDCSTLDITPQKLNVGVELQDGSDTKAQDEPEPEVPVADEAPGTGEGAKGDLTKLLVQAVELDSDKGSGSEVLANCSTLDTEGVMDSGSASQGGLEKTNKDKSEAAEVGDETEGGQKTVDGDTVPAVALDGFFYGFSLLMRMLGFIMWLFKVLYSGGQFLVVAGTHIHTASKCALNVVMGCYGLLRIMLDVGVGQCSSSLPSDVASCSPDVASRSPAGTEVPTGEPDRAAGDDLMLCSAASQSTELDR